MAEWIVERPEGHAPQFIPFRTVGQQAEILEEHVDILPVADRTRRGRTIGRPLDDLLSRAGRLLLPEDSVPWACEWRWSGGVPFQNR